MVFQLIGEKCNIREFIIWNYTSILFTEPEIGLKNTERKCDFRDQSQKMSKPRGGNLGDSDKSKGGRG